MRTVPNKKDGAEPFSDRSDVELCVELEELRTRFEKLANHLQGRKIQVSAEEVNFVIKARSLRFDLFAWGLFAEPAWDMLLHLYAKHLARERVAVTKLCTASGVPPTTALRHIGHLERQGLVIRKPDPLDSRRIWVELSAAGSDSMQRYFQQLSAAA